VAGCSQRCRHEPPGGSSTPSTGEVRHPAPGLLRRHTSAPEAGLTYAVRYEVALDDAWRTREARVWSDTVDGPC
jgi:hypothetical protein